MKLTSADDELIIIISHGCVLLFFEHDRFVDIVVECLYTDWAKPFRLRLVINRHRTIGSNVYICYIAKFLFVAPHCYPLPTCMRAYFVWWAFVRMSVHICELAAWQLSSKLYGRASALCCCLFSGNYYFDSFEVRSCCFFSDYLFSRVWVSVGVCMCLCISRWSTVALGIGGAQATCHISWTLGTKFAKTLIKRHCRGVERVLIAPADS